MVSEAQPAAAREGRTERWSGITLAALMLAAFALAGQRIVAIATGPRPPRTGDVAPAFSAQALDDRPIALADHRGKVVLLDFWATWCPPCVASMPHLEQISSDYRDRVVVLGVNQEPGDEETVRRFLSDRGITFPSVVDPGPIHVEYGVFSYPSSFVIDRDGVIRASFRGPAPAAQLRRALDDALGAR